MHLATSITAAGCKVQAALHLSNECAAVLKEKSDF